MPLLVALFFLSSLGYADFLLEHKTSICTQPKQFLANLGPGLPVAVVPFSAAQIIAAVQGLPKDNIPKFCDSHQRRGFHLYDKAVFFFPLLSFSQFCPVSRDRARLLSKSFPFDIGCLGCP